VNRTSLLLRGGKTSDRFEACVVVVVVVVDRWKRERETKKRVLPH
jgi:hypothetical protein